MQKALWSAFVDLALFMRSELLNQVSKLTVIEDVSGVKCWYAIPLQDVGPHSQLQDLVTTLNKFKKSKVRERRVAFVHTLA
jgi:hypothetical protein